MEELHLVEPHGGLKALEVIVQEIEKKRPNYKRLEKLMSEIGLPYSSDPVELMTTVIEALSRHTKIGRS